MILYDGMNVFVYAILNQCDYTGFVQCHLDIGRALEIQMTALNCVPERPLVDARDLRYPYLMVKSPLNHQYFATL